MIYKLFLKVDLWRARGELDAIREYIKTEQHVDKQTFSDLDYYKRLVSRLERQLAEYKWSFEFTDLLAIFLMGSFAFMIWG